MKSPEQQKRDNDWSLLANQVVGGETFPTTEAQQVTHLKNALTSANAEIERLGKRVGELEEALHNLVYMHRTGATKEQMDVKFIEALSSNPPTKQFVSREVACRLFTYGYLKGHHDTVEGQFVDVLPQDEATYFQDVVDEALYEKEIKPNG